MKKWKTGKIIRDSDLNRWNNLELTPYNANNITFNMLINQKEYHPINFENNIYYNYTFGYNNYIYSQEDPYYWLSFGDHNFRAYDTSTFFSYVNNEDS